jgi:prepilin-type N-terminal cleavage/methylation domain-containing protein
MLRKLVKVVKVGLAGRQKGFTLIEVMTVIAIIGVLAAIAVPNLINFVNTGKAEAMETERDSVQAAMIALMFDNEITSVVPRAAPLGDLNGWPLWVGKQVGDNDFGVFLVDADVEFEYSWNNEGVVSVSE